MKKRVLILLTAFAMVFGISACGTTDGCGGRECNNRGF